MKIISFLVSLYISLKSFVYGVYEIKQEKNKYGGYAVISISILAFLLPNLILYLR